MPQAGASGSVQVAGGRPIGIFPEPHIGCIDQRREQVLERTRLGFVRDGNGHDIFAAALQCRLDPDRIINPGRHWSAGATANGSKARQHLSNWQPVSFQSPIEQQPVAAGTRAAPRGEAPGGQIGMRSLPRQRCEFFGQELVDGRSASNQAFIKNVHATCLKPGPLGEAFTADRDAAARCGEAR